MKKQQRKIITDEKFFVHYNSQPDLRRSNLLIVADCMVDRSFINGLCKRLNTNADLLYIDTSRETRKPVLYRHFSYLILAVNVFFIEKRYRIILFWQQFVGLYYGLIAHIKKPTQSYVFLMPFIFKSRKGILGKIHRLLFNLALQHSAIKGAICHSYGELIYYRKIFSGALEKIYFIPYGQTSRAKENKAKMSGGNLYFFCGGTSNRDYRMVVCTAEKMKYPFVIACTPNDIKGLNIPSNVQVFHDAYGDKFDSLMKACFAVILPLQDPNISSGQIVLLKAMEIGKPVVVTRSAGIEDYVDENCAFLVNTNDPEELRKVLELIISNSEEAHIRAKNAQKKYQEKFTIQKFAFSVADLIKKTLEA